MKTAMSVFFHNNAHMTKPALVGAVSLALMLGAGCSTDASKTDLDEPKFNGDVGDAEVTSRAPDETTIFLNADGHPNIVRVCIDGLAFRTISNVHNGGLDGAVARVPGWDAVCAG